MMGEVRSAVEEVVRVEEWEWVDKARGDGHGKEDGSIVGQPAARRLAQGLRRESAAAR